MLQLIATCRVLIGWKVKESLESLNINERRYPSDLELVELNKGKSFITICREKLGLDLSAIYYHNLGK